jgi:TPP-dependent pyruvate/acetoin dehydrogenase alpha subunit
MTEEEADQIEAEIRQEVLDSIEFARVSPSPRPEAGLEHVFAGMSVAPSQFVS